MLQAPEYLRVLNKLAHFERKLEREYFQGIEDIYAFGAPSECMGLIGKRVHREWLAALRAAGYTVETYERALRQHCNVRNCISGVLGVPDHVGC